MDIPQKVLSSFEVLVVDEQSSVVLLAIHPDFGMNEATEIDCEAGTPISTFVYDNVNNIYKFFCRDFLSLGTIPVSFKLDSKSHGWEKIYVPAPPEVIEEFLNESQLMLAKRFKESHGGVMQFDYLQFTFI